MLAKNEAMSPSIRSEDITVKSEDDTCHFTPKTSRINLQASNLFSRGRENSEGFLDLEEFKSAIHQELNETEKIAFGPFPIIEASPRFQIVNDFILSQDIGDWRNLYFNPESNQGLISSRHKYAHKQIIQSIRQDNLCNGQSRKYAWCLLLGITHDLMTTSYRDLYNGLKREIFSLNKSTLGDLQAQRQISMDVPRTFSQQEISNFQQPISSQDNSLYNVLACYAKIAPDVGYCQGMNFFAGMILIGVDFDEVIAFAMLFQLMGDQGNFRNLYNCTLQMLYSLADEV